MDLEALKNMYKSNVDTYGLDSLPAIARSLAYIDKASWERRQYAASLVFINTSHEISVPVSGYSVLDVGCGTGELYNHLGPKRYVGVDLVEEFIAHAKSEWGEDDCTEFICDDYMNLSLQPHDYAFAMGTFAFMFESAALAMLDRMWADTIYACTFDLPASHYTPGHILTSFIHPRQPYFWVLRHEHNTYTVYMYKNPKWSDTVYMYKNPKSNDQEN